MPSPQIPTPIKVGFKIPFLRVSSLNRKLANPSHNIEQLKISHRSASFSEIGNDDFNLVMIHILAYILEVAQPDGCRASALPYEIGSGIYSQGDALD